MKKIYKIYLISIGILLGLSTISFMFILFKNDILPIKYLIPLVLLLLIIGILLIFLMFKKSFKWLSSIISIFLIIIYIIFQILLNKTIAFIEGTSDAGILTENYLILVLKDSKKNIENINSLGYSIQENQNIDNALNKLSESLIIDDKEYDDLEKLVDGLYENDVDAIIILDTYYNMYGEENKTFKTNTKIIYKFTVEKEINEIQKPVNTKKDTFNIYISGIDTYGPISSVSRSDVNIVASINPNTNKILLTTIPRDYYVELDGTTGLKDKLTHAGIYGVEKSIKTIENLLDIDINYYVKINFSSVEKIVDALGGVDVYSKYSFTGFNGSSFNAGYNKVNGAKALEFARTRKTVTGGDRTRGINQEALIEAILSKVCSAEVLTRYSNLLNSLEGSFETNMTKDEIISIIKNQIDEGKKWSVESISLDGTDSSEYTYSYSGKKLYVMIPNQDTIDNFHEKLKNTLN